MLCPCCTCMSQRGGDGLVHGGLPCRHWGPVSSAFLLTASSCLWAPARTPGFNTREKSREIKDIVCRGRGAGVGVSPWKPPQAALVCICLSESLLGPGGSPLPPLLSDPHSPLLSPISLCAQSLRAPSRRPILFCSHWPRLYIGSRAFLSFPPNISGPEFRFLSTL